MEVLVFFYCKCCACSKSGQQNDNLLPIRYLNVKILKRQKSKEKMSSKKPKAQESKNDVKPKSQVRIKVSHRK
jgi:hypothetical protein